MGIFPKWVSELSWQDFWGGVKEDVAKIPKTVGSTVKDVVQPILAGVRKGLTPTVIWIIVIAVIALILFTYFKKAVRI
ncbi:hypothetical protein ES703_67336 [subsurface metagenome]